MLLHGLFATADINWVSAYSDVAREFRVVALDQRGHGHGIRGRARLRLADCADDVVALADALDISTFIPVGYSMGGTIAQLVWHRHANRVDGLVLCATSATFRPPREVLAFEVLAIANLLVRATPPAVRRRVAEHMVGRRASTSARAQWAWTEFRRSDPVKLIEGAQALVRYTAHDWIDRVDVPTAVVVTSRDRLVAPKWQRARAAAVPDARVFEVDGDHPVLMEACLDVGRRARSRA